MAAAVQCWRRLANNTFVHARGSDACQIDGANFSPIVVFEIVR